MLEIKKASLGFGGRRLFKPISLKIPRGEVMLLTARAERENLHYCIGFAAPRPRD